jgi:hypothetical protein
MVSKRQIDIDELAMNFNFSLERGAASLYMRNPDKTILDKVFNYSAIKAQGNRSWVFEGAPLNMSLRNDSTLVVQFTDEGGREQTRYFASLAMSVQAIIEQEKSRRTSLYLAVFDRGPEFASAYYGSLSLAETGDFIWTGSRVLAPQIIPAQAFEAGRIEMSLFLDASLSSRYDGALSFMFDTPNGLEPVNFLYVLDSPSGMRIEYVPPTNLEGSTVIRRASSPVIIYFYHSDPDILSGVN